MIIYKGWLKANRIVLIYFEKIVPISSGHTVLMVWLNVHLLSLWGQYVLPDDNL